MTIPATRPVWAATLRVGSSLITLVAGYAVGWGSPTWHTRPSLAFVRQNPVPWWAYGTAFMLAALLILPPLRTPAWHIPRVLGWALGAALYVYFAFAADWAAGVYHTPYSPPVLAAINGWALVWTVATVAAAEMAIFHARDEVTRSVSGHG